MTPEGHKRKLVMLLENIRLATTSMERSIKEPWDYDQQYATIKHLERQYQLFEKEFFRGRT